MKPAVGEGFAKLMGNVCVCWVGVAKIVKNVLLVITEQYAFQNVRIFIIVKPAAFVRTVSFELETSQRGQGFALLWYQIILIFLGFPLAFLGVLTVH